jgi:general stress protein 26
MPTAIKDPAAVEGRLWEEIERHQTGMLGLVGGSAHFQPMTAFVDRDAERIWFFTRADTDLARQIAAGHPAMFVFQQRDLQACIGGELTLSHDRARMDKYWNAVVAAWYPGGKDDPNLTLIRMQCADAQVWISEGGPVRFAWEIAKANATHRPPQVGGAQTLNFH